MYLENLTKSNRDLKIAYQEGLNYFLGASADCSSYDTTFECTDSFSGTPLTLRVDVKVCQRPVVVDLHLEIMGLLFDQQIDGNQEIPLPGVFMSGIGDFFLTVNVDPNNDGDVTIKVCFD